MDKIAHQPNQVQMTTEEVKIIIGDLNLQLYSLQKALAIANEHIKKLEGELNLLKETKDG